MIELPVILFGVGGVGRSLLRQILDQRQRHAQRYDLRIRILALCDSRGALLEPIEEFDDAQLEEILARKTDGQSLSEHPLGGTQDDLAAIVDIVGRPDTVVVDCTASEASIPALIFALERGYRIALANKKPLTVEESIYRRLTQRSEEESPLDPGRARWEATVGAGLPVIATLNRLMASGDEVSRIAGTFSGTLGYLMTGLQEGRVFSEVVTDAFNQGYTEPDPRDDLGGVDVARKALILARGLGWSLDLDDIDIEPLYPEAMGLGSVEEFMQALPSMDASYREQIEGAAVENKRLRYGATIENGACRVGLVTVAADSPLGRLQGTDNLVEFTSRWYSPNPLVIQGRGAGVEATAAGVLSDIIELAYAA